MDNFWELENRLMPNVRTNRTLIGCQPSFKRERASLYPFVLFLGQTNPFGRFHGPRSTLRANSLTFAHAHSMRAAGGPLQVLNSKDVDKRV
jgi:hypothetical protein